MKTIAKHYSKLGNVCLVQFETLEGEGFPFRVAGPFIEEGSLTIKELDQSGAVNTLLAINPTNQYLLLTDMDLLMGAKQNRTVNTSVLIAPNSKQEISVSCVERSRWSYDGPDFKPGSDILDLKMRSSKAGWLREDSKKKSSKTQSKVWGMINDEMMSADLYSQTEDYNEILAHRKDQLEDRIRTMPEFKLKEGMNGLAVFQGSRLLSFDVYGNREAYRHYFQMLSEGILYLVSEGEAMGKAEAYYRFEEKLDEYRGGLDPEIDPEAGGAGDLRWSGLKDYTGFELSFRSQLVHLAGMQVK